MVVLTKLDCWLVKDGGSGLASSASMSGEEPTPGHSTITSR
jgi:hypothetical protein